MNTPCRRNSKCEMKSRRCKFHAQLTTFRALGLLVWTVVNMIRKLCQRQFQRTQRMDAAHQPEGAFLLMGRKANIPDPGSKLHHGEKCVVRREHTKRKSSQQ